MFLTVIILSNYNMSLHAANNKIWKIIEHCGIYRAVGQQKVVEHLFLQKNHKIQKIHTSNCAVCPFHCAMLQMIHYGTNETEQG